MGTYRTYKKRRSRSVRELSHTDKHLAGLLQQASGFEYLNRLLAPLLGPDLAAQVRVACLRDGELIVLANSPVWASRVRMVTSRLLTQLKPRLDNLQSIKVRVVPQKQPPAAAILRRPLSKSARKSLQQFADSCVNDDLKAIAEDLSKHKGR